MYKQLTLKITYPVLEMLEGKCFLSPVGTNSLLFSAVSGPACVASKFGSLSSRLHVHMLKSNTN